jgi:plastocyanin
MQKLSRLIGWRAVALAAVAALAATAAALNVAPTATSATTATTYTAIVGGEGPGQAAYINAFMPASLVITEGDSIQWKGVAGAHTVAFLNNQPPPKEITLDTIEDPIGGRNPTYDGTKQLYSGFIVPDPSTFYTVKFTKAGNFPFICLIHPGQVGSVTVLSPGLFVPTQAQIDADGRKVQADGEAAVRRMTASNPTTAARTANANGTSTWTVPSSPYAAIPNGFVSQDIFTPARISIGAGDTVTWLEETPAAHNVALLDGKPPAGDPTKPTPQRVYTGGFASSGIIGKAPGIGPELFTGGDRYSLTFPNPGTYPYVCILHVDAGMAGVIEVGPRGSVAAAPPPAGPAPAPAGGAPIVLVRPPSTGDGGLSDSVATAWPLALLVAVTGVMTLGAMHARARI